MEGGVISTILAVLADYSRPGIRKSGWDQIGVLPQDVPQDCSVQALEAFLELVSGVPEEEAGKDKPPPIILRPRLQFLTSLIFLGQEFHQGGFAGACFPGNVEDTASDTEPTEESLPIISLCFEILSLLSFEYLLLPTSFGFNPLTLFRLISRIRVAVFYFVPRTRLVEFRLIQQPAKGGLVCGIDRSLSRRDAFEPKYV